MSYYIGIFEPSAVPQNKPDFIAWFKKISQWEEDRDYDSPDGICEKLNRFYFEIIKTFPPLNGKYSPADEDILDDARLVDYCICNELIYMSSAWSVCEEFDAAVDELAGKLGLGLLRFTYDGYDITLPKSI